MTGADYGEVDDMLTLSRPGARLRAAGRLCRDAVVSLYAVRYGYHEKKQDIDCNERDTKVLRARDTESSTIRNGSR